MKRLDLVQLTVIIVGIVSAALFLQNLPGLIFYLSSWLIGGTRGGFFYESVISTILYMAVYLLTAIYAVKNSKQIAEKICSSGNFESDINFTLHKGELLFVALIAIGIYGLIKTIPSFCLNIYNLTIEKNHQDGMPKYIMPFERDGMFENTCYIILNIIVLVYARVFADFFAGRIIM